MFLHNVVYIPDSRIDSRIHILTKLGESFQLSNSVDTRGRNVSDRYFIRAGSLLVMSQENFNRLCWLHLLHRHQWTHKILGISIKSNKNRTQKLNKK